MRPRGDAGAAPFDARSPAPHRQRFERRRAGSLRTTLAIAFVLVAIGVTALVGVLSYRSAARLVRVDQEAVFDEVVHDLRVQVRQHTRTPDDFASGDPDHDGPRDELTRRLGTDVQVLDALGAPTDRGRPALPVDVEARRTAGATTPGALTKADAVRIDGDEYRVATVALGGRRGAVQVAQQFSDTEDLLKELQKRTLLFAAAVVLAAGLFGWWLAGRITSRLVRLAETAEQVASTGRFDVAVPVTGGDEVASLGRSFDRMLGRLARSVEDQRRLVQDAGHELRTPLTSLRTNISLLRRIDELPRATREELVDDLTSESRELTDLVNELVDLAAGQQNDEPPVEVALADIAQDVATVARRRTGRTVTVRSASDTTVIGRPAQLQRALSNLVENATKFDAHGTDPVEIVVTRGGAGNLRAEVLDRGPGLSDVDIERVFDRFYRAPAARSLPGSGLGLSIVREVAAAHGGVPFAARREGGGAVIGFTITRVAPG